MGRGQNLTRRENDPSEGWSKQELLDAASGGEHGALSGKTFDLIRKAARVNGPSHGGNTWVFSVDDLIALVKRAESGAFSERGRPAAVAWRTLLAERGVELD